ncbi:hypothetical protein BGX33_004656, partial [Mortierella sp. NVP41]
RHKPVILVLDDRKWPFTAARHRAYRRRRQFIEQPKAAAKEKEESINAFLDAFTKAKRDCTINSSQIEMEKTKA